RDWSSDVCSSDLHQLTGDSHVVARVLEQPCQDHICAKLLARIGRSLNASRTNVRAGRDLKVAMHSQLRKLLVQDFGEPPDEKLLVSTGSRSLERKDREIDLGRKRHQRCGVAS